MPSLTTVEVLCREALEIHGRPLMTADAKIEVLKAANEWPLEPNSDKECELLAEVYKDLHSLNSTALCLSGGGIRSAAFALGVLESLARHHLLDHFHYLSTVSGGGYIGSWLSAWIKRHGRVGAFEDLAKQRMQIVHPPAAPKLLPDREPAPLHALRFDSNYLTPKLGLMSADTWTGVAMYIRNMLMNWVVIGSFVSAAVMVPHIVAALLHSTTTPLMGWFAVAISAILAMAAWSVAVANRPTWGYLRMGQGSYLGLDLAPILLASLAWIAALRSGVINPNESWAVCPYLGPLANFFLDLGLAGGALAIVSWILGARPWNQPASREPFRRRLWDAAATGIAGAIFGLLVAWGSSLYHGFAQTHPDAVVILAVVLGPLWILQAQVVGESFFVGLRSAAKLGSDDREWLARSAGWYSAAGLSWMIFCALTLLGPVAISRLTNYYIPHLVASAGGISAVLTTLLGKSPLTSFKQSARTAPLNIVLAIAAPILAVSLVVGLSSLAAWLLHDGAELANFATELSGPWWAPVLWLVGLAAVGGVTSYFVNVNRFSLHSVYRDRLIRAFLGASRERQPNPFTGSDSADNLSLSTLWPQGEPAADRPPFHVVNIALNVVSTRNLAWQERMAEPFVATALHCGSDRVGYRPTRDYAANLSLGTAMAISGAAASPNMGYHSSPPLTFLLALFNVRLGWWLGNPGPEGERTFQTDGPKLGAWWLVQEVLGLTTDDRGYVYLSDGGHFENLGLYEMVRRRCRYIVVSDAGCDPRFDFEDLGNAVRKIRIDLGVEIDFLLLDEIRKRRRLPADEQCCSTATPAGPSEDPITKLCWAVGRIRYPEVDPTTRSPYLGYILYLKPGLRGDEPADVRSYAAASAAFPHESTADQWFGESQFESYRALGEHVMTNVIVDPRIPKPPTPLTLQTLLQACFRIASA